MSDPKHQYPTRKRRYFSQGVFVALSIACAYYFGMLSVETSFFPVFVLALCFGPWLVYVVGNLLKIHDVLHGWPVAHHLNRQIIWLALSLFVFWQILVWADGGGHSADLPVVRNIFTGECSAHSRPIPWYLEEYNEQPCTRGLHIH